MHSRLNAFSNNKALCLMDVIESFSAYTIGWMIENGSYT